MAYLILDGWHPDGSSGSACAKKNRVLRPTPLTCRWQAVFSDDVIDDIGQQFTGTSVDRRFVIRQYILMSSGAIGAVMSRPSVPAAAIPTPRRAMRCIATACGDDYREHVRPAIAESGHAARHFLRRRSRISGYRKTPPSVPARRHTSRVRSWFGSRAGGPLPARERRPGP